MVFDPNNYLDIYHIVTYEIIGDVWLMFALGIILIGYISARNAIPFQAVLAFMLLWAAIVSIISGYFSLWTLFICAVGVLYYWIISRFLRRG